MKLQPLQKYAEPHLPTRDIVDEHPELLRLLPKRWQANSVVVAALGACLAITACSGKTQAADTPTKVAPVFEHGKGSGSFGCSAVNPPVFLSEGDARQVIIEEAKRAGIRFGSDGRTLNSITMPTNGELARVDDGKGGAKWEPKTGTQVVSVAVDGLEQKRNIAFEYISETDLEELKTGTTTWGMVISQDMLGTARALADGIAKRKPGGVYGVFYDPAVGWSDAYDTMKPIDYSKGDWQTRGDETKRIANQMAREELRRQVQDFIKWLKAQGVI